MCTITSRGAQTVPASALLVFGSVNYSIYAKERIKRDGEVIFLELGSLDPRSLMQGDYMALRFLLASQLETQRHPTEGFVTVRLDAQRVAGIAASDSIDGLRLHYRMRHGRVGLGTYAYFFEEGSAARFAPAMPCSSACATTDCATHEARLNPSRDPCGSVRLQEALNGDRPVPRGRAAAVRRIAIL